MCIRDSFQIVVLGHRAYLAVPLDQLLAQCGIDELHGMPLIGQPLLVDLRVFRGAQPAPTQTPHAAPPRSDERHASAAPPPPPRARTPPPGPARYAQESET